ncbi:MAG: hypothetical protein H6981_10795 [Gammaproteobacteria bacterium]|nr:hypothetical protein [Gammaproteobacteria bacterium]MCP5137276.1 hypothetical protein [Gammaproteobacteria bacterium]
MGQMIRQMAFAIADAQQELDESSVEVAEMMSGRRILRGADGEALDANLEPIEVDENGAVTGIPAYIDTRVFFGHEYDQDGNRKPTLLSMMELGFTPTFYQFIDTIIEVKIAITITASNEYSKTTSGEEQKVVGYKTTRKRGVFSSKTKTTPIVQTQQVDATYTSKYSYSAEGSSLLRTKLVPVPPPAILEERIRALIELDEAKKAEDEAEQ